MFSFSLWWPYQVHYLPDCRQRTARVRTMRLLLRCYLFAFIGACTAVAVGQQAADTGKAIAAIQDEIQWINEMTATGAMPQDIADKRIKELTFKAGQLALGLPNSVVP